jgi:hypothetical protein
MLGLLSTGTTFYTQTECKMAEGKQKHRTIYRIREGKDTWEDPEVDSKIFSETSEHEHGFAATHR